MTELTKAEQKRLAREEELLDLAIDILAEQGLNSLTLEKLTARSPYSKGTIYNHFCSKEDCVSALCCRAMSSMLALFALAFRFEGELREQALALHFAHQLYSQINPTLFQVVLVGKAPGVRENTSDKRNAVLDELEERVNNASDSMFRQALEQGKISRPVTVETLTFASWAMSFGSLALAHSAADATAISRLESSSLLLNNISLLLDGMGWQPLSYEWDYNASWQRIAQHFQQLTGHQPTINQPSEN
ncbi:TetR/AcrR family transcriptional regulator [Bacterioplanoides sp.]|uniref:TetR/AcrR family transcriptional regulator n=1 Tax=Bacterioplanoides sp. TaxID=2066072 RepID=UPI003B00A626